MTDFLLMMTCGSPWLYSISLFVLSGFLWLIIFGLCKAASDHDCRIEKYLMEDEHEDITKY